MVLAILTSRRSQDIFDSKEDTVKSAEGLGGGTNIAHFKRDYRLLKAALEAKGIPYKFIPWDEPNEDWSQYSAGLIYSPWNYNDNRALFLEALAKMKEAGVVLLNSLETMTWNTDKRYLLDLVKWDIPIIPTVFADDTAGNVNIPASIEDLRSTTGSNRFILKPCVSAGSSNIFRVESADEAQSAYQEHLQGKPFMIQPFLQEVCDEGEWSFVFLDGKYSHSFLRQTEVGGYKVQHSNDKQDMTPLLAPGMLEQAQRIFDKIVQERGGEVPLILRVDVVKGKDGILRVMEIEQVDPFLYLYSKPGVAAENLCEGVLKAVPQLRPAAARNASAPGVEKRLSAEIS
jgi:hypothetical protein